jgi:UDP-2-acetamido-3-amino-2,3-dideoxy-glucuronate N-acetyltransferase
MSEYGHKLIFDENGMAVCPESGQEYRMEGNNVIRIK